MSQKNKNSDVEKVLEDDKNTWKYAHVSFKGKEKRKLLKGFTCNDCESYYKAQSLTEEQYHDAVQRCSKHRATVVPPKDSPKGTH